MFGRQVTAALRRPLQARLRTTAAPQNHTTLCIRTFSHAPRSLEGHAGRPRKAVGEPSRPVKRSVKTAAKKSTSTDTKAAEKKIAAKEKAAAQKKKAAEKAAAQKAKAKAKRELTPEQLEKKKLALQKAQLSDLKKIALAPPQKSLHTSAWMQFSATKSHELKQSASELSETGTEKRQAVEKLLAAHAANISAEWKSKSSSDLEHYNHLAHTAREAARAEYKRYVESYTPEEIKLANGARRKLRSRGDKKDVRKWPAVHDERAAKRPVTSYMQFSISRQASGDFKNIAVQERAKLISQEWKALSEEEKQKYKNLAARDSERYASEESSIDGSSSSGETQSYASAA